MVRRSYYLDRAVVDALAAAVDDLHWSTRTPKHEVMAAVISAGLAHLDEVRTHLTP